MEIVLEMREVERLLRQALATEGCLVPVEMRMTTRANHKKGTTRIVFSSPCPQRAGTA